MTLHPLHDIPLSHAARCIFACLRESGGSMRIGPLLRGLGRISVSERAFAEATFDLAERYWITIVWRSDAPAATSEAQPLAGIDRLTATRFGRRKHRQLTGEPRLAAGRGSAAK
jgi:hypothetical protein